MKRKRSFILKLTGLFMILAAVLLLTVSIPRTTQAATRLFESQNIKKVRISGNTIEITGRNRSLTTYDLQRSRKHTFKATSKTQYKNLVDTETGKTKKITKKTALRKLKSKNFIAVYIYYKTGGKITKILFGV